MRLRKKGDWK